MKKTFFAFFSTFLTFSCIAQPTIGLPNIISYGKDTYNAGTQNWNIRQDNKGIVYFANNEGLLSFDGTYWKLYPLPNKTIVRSIEIGSDNKIYVGGQDEIGYFSPNQTGNLSYTSLKNLLPENEQTFADIWHIVSHNNQVFFRSGKKIFELTANRIKVFKADDGWNFLGASNTAVLAQQTEGGLLVYDRDKWNVLIPADQLPKGFIITSCTPYDQNSTLLTTIQHGVYLLKDNKITASTLTGSGISPKEAFSSSSQIDAETFALGTYGSGCYIVNKNGFVTQHFYSKSGLQNSNVRSLFIDRNKNIWLGLDRGIDFIAFNNAIKVMSPANLNDGAGYASLVYNNELYVALSNGIYHLPIGNVTELSEQKDDFRLVANTEGQAWGLSIVNNNLLAGKHEGLFQIVDNKATPVLKGTGFWTVQSLNQEDFRSPVIAGNYQGIQILNYNDNIFTPKETIAGFNESTRFVTIDDKHDIWASHPYRGVFKIELSADRHSVVKLFTTADGLPSNLNNHIYKIRNQVVVATIKGIYEYSDKARRFQPSAYYENIFGETGIRYLKEDSKGNVWFIREKNLGVVDFSNKKPEIIDFPELKGKMVSGFEHVFPLNNKNILVGADKGFYHINYEKYKQNKPAVNVFIRNVETLGKTDSVLFGGYASDDINSKPRQQASTAKISYQSNSLHIEYSSPLYEQQSNIEYSFLLEGFDNKWSDWSKKTEKDFSYLPAGSYTFSVKARNNLGNESPSASYSFIVLPPWYQTVWAYIAYTILTVTICFFLYKRHKKQLFLQKQKHEEEQKRLQYLHQLEIEKSEKKIVKLRNEKLEIEIESKNSELASTAMNLVQKGELLTKIKEDLKRLNKTLKNTEELDDVKKIIHVLTVEEKMNEDWDQFAIHFNKVHSDFLICLKDRHPNLNAHELKLCAYLRMNLSSKEIAQLSNISVRGVELSRYRLRKKLQLPTEVNLFQFLLDIQAEKTSLSN
jgi:ligand-binding sensor domain-containing protein